MYWLHVTSRDQHKYVLVIYRQLPVTAMTTFCTQWFAILGYLKESRCSAMLPSAEPRHCNICSAVQQRINFC
jgi:hypothetical protein